MSLSGAILYEKVRINNKFKSAVAGCDIVAVPILDSRADVSGHRFAAIAP